MRLPDNYVTNLYTDHKGRVWILGYQSVSIVDFGVRTIHSFDIYDFARHTFYSMLFDICEVQGRYYLASYGGGVVVLDSAYRLVRNLSVQNNLTAITTAKIIPYKDSLLFVTSNHGLSVVNLSKNDSVQNFYESDGLHSDNLEEYSGAIRNNIIYVGGVDGITVIDPARLPAVLPPPPIYIRQVTTESRNSSQDTSNLLLSALDIPENVLQTTIYLSAVDYQNPTRSLLQYRVKEQEGDWINIGTRDILPLTGISPGKYTLQFRSANKDGLWSSRPVELYLHFLPKWYQTFWFKLLVIIFIAGLFYTFYLYRMRQIWKQQQIRKDIASDLHDDIGSTLNTVKIFTHLARRDQQKEEYLYRIEESLTQASAGLRDLIWVLDDSGDTVKDLAERIKRFAMPVTQVKEISFDCSVASAIMEMTVSKPVKRNLLLIAKETINNSIKYSGCQHIQVSITDVKDKLLMSIRDDGHGFDTQDTVSGNGLRNIQNRARQIGFTASITSSSKGTLIEIQG